MRAIAELGYNHVTVNLECAYLRLKLESEAYLEIDDLYLVCSDPSAPLSSQRCSHICLLEGLSLGGVGIWIYSDGIRLKKIGSLVLGNSGLSVKFRSEYCFGSGIDLWGCEEDIASLCSRILVYRDKDYGVVLLVPAEWEAIPGSLERH
ncbi:10894_t:CDS:2 [Gigaspora rosea]|nr:10894_t:CDS:2 [Gigaspora rosea]